MAKKAKKYYANIGDSYSASEIALEVGADNKITAFHDFEVDGKEYKAKQFLGKNVSALREEFGSSLKDIEEIKSWADVNADESEFERVKPASKPKKGILSGIKAATESQPTMLTGPEPVQGGRTTKKVGALQNILGSRKTQTSGLSKNSAIRSNQLGIIFDNYIKNINQYTGKYKKASKKLNQQNITTTNKRTGLSKRVTKKPNMLSPGEHATDLLQKLNKVEKHTFTNIVNYKGKKYPDITVSNKDMRFVTQHLARELQKHAKNKNIFLGGAEESVLERLSADVVLSDSGEVTRGGKLSGKDFHITSNIDDVNVPGLMIEDTNTGNLIRGEEGGRAGEALHAEERSVTGSGEAYNRSQIPGNPKVPYKGVNMHLNPKGARKLKSDPASSLSSVVPGDGKTVSGKMFVASDQFNEFKPDKHKGKRISFARPEQRTFSQSLLTMKVSDLKSLMDARNTESQPRVQSGWQSGVDRLISGDPMTVAELDHETGNLVEVDTKTEIEESKFLSTDTGEQPDTKMTFDVSQGDIEYTNRKMAKTLLTGKIQDIKSTQGVVKANEFELGYLVAEQMDEMQNWNEGRTSGKTSGGGVWEMDGGYDSEGKYVKKGADTKVNPPTPLESFDKRRAAKFPPGPWLSGYVFESEGMHEKTKPVKYQPGPWKDDYNFPVEDPPDLKPPRKPGDAVSYVIQGQEKVEARKAGETNVPRTEIKPLKETPQSTLLTSKDPVPNYDQWETDWQEAPGRESHIKRKEGQPTVVSKKRQPKADDPNISGVQVEKELTGTFEQRQKRLNPSMKPKVIWTAGMPYLGLGVDIIQGLRVMKESKKSKKEFNLGSFIPAWAKKIAYGESIPRS
ncbi:hypothetical protein [uncultured Mediterranean phage uvMED]|nr:hypothetical protein [uncultured Mediterranean phage uvMED]